MRLLEDFVSRWERRAEEYSRIGVVAEAAKVVLELLSDFGATRDLAEAELLTLRQAAKQSGYSEDHIGRLVREGKIPNSGRRGAPRIRVGDVPSPREFARTRSRSYDVDADARMLRNGRQ